MNAKSTVRHVEFIGSYNFEADYRVFLDDDPRPVRVSLCWGSSDHVFATKPGTERWQLIGTIRVHHSDDFPCRAILDYFDRHQRAQMAPYDPTWEPELVPTRWDSKLGRYVYPKGQAPREPVQSGRPDPMFPEWFAPAWVAEQRAIHEYVQHQLATERAATA